MDSAGEVQTGLANGGAGQRRHPTTSLAEPVPSSSAAAAPEQVGSRGVGRQKGVFLVNVNDWDSASRDNLRASGR